MESPITCPNCNREMVMARFCIFCGNKITTYNQLQDVMAIIELEDQLLQETGVAIEYVVENPNEKCSEEWHVYRAKTFADLQEEIPQFKGAEFCERCGSKLPKS